MGIDLKDFYLNTPMERYEYMLIPITMIPQDKMKKYKLQDIVHNGMVLGKVIKIVYGLPHTDLHTIYLCNIQKPVTMHHQNILLEFSNTRPKQSHSVSWLMISVSNLYTIKKPNISLTI